jgi:hypothetical protein
MECKGAGVDRHLATQCSPAWMAAANPMTQVNLNPRHS